MSPSNFSSYRVHRIVEYIKSMGFIFETDELLETGLKNILNDNYNIFQELTDDEFLFVMDELLPLAENNEIKEALVKLKEVLPEDTGDEILNQHLEKGYEKATSYLVHYSYPVDKNLREIKISRMNQHIDNK
ncbi:hypothetical protein ACFL6B_04570 [Thermodesulfobacteriota bacterium]